MKKKVVKWEDLCSDPILRAEVMKSYAEHLESGFKGESFQIDKKLIEKCYQAYTQEFESMGIDLSASEREGYRFWESIGRAQALGECLGNARAWTYNMANRYGWRDRQETDAKHTGNVAVSIVSYGSQGTQDTKEA